MQRAKRAKKMRGLWDFLKGPHRRFQEISREFSGNRAKQLGSG